MFWMVKFIPADLYIPRFKKSQFVSANQNRAMFYKYCGAVLKQLPTPNGWKRHSPEIEFFDGFKYTSREKAENMVRLACDNLGVLPSGRHEVCQVLEFDKWPDEYIQFIDPGQPQSTIRSTLIPRLKQAKRLFETSFDYCYKCQAIIPPDTFYMEQANVKICGLCFMEMAASIEDSMRQFELKDPEFYNRLHSARIVHHL